MKNSLVDKVPLKELQTTTKKKVMKKKLPPLPIAEEKKSKQSFNVQSKAIS